MSLSILSKGVKFNKTKQLPLEETKKDENIEQTSYFRDCREEKNFYNKLERKIKMLLKKENTEPIKNKLNKLLEKKRMMKDLLLENLGINIKEDENIVPLCDFKEVQEKFQLSKKFVDIVEKHYKYKYPSPIQSCVIDLLFQRKNVIAISETGSGKTFSYVVPVVQTVFQSKRNKSSKKALIILPTKELLIQIFNDFNVFCSLYTDNRVRVKQITNILLKSNKNEDFKNFLENTEIFLSTPTKALDFLRENPTVVEDLEYLILDEADRYFDLGFIEIIDDILMILKDKPVVKGFFSATLLEEVEEIITTHLVDPSKVQIGIHNVPAKTINQKITYCTNYEGKLLAIRNIMKKGFNPPILVFCDKQENIDKLFSIIQYEIPKVSFIHSGLDQKTREQVVSDFRQGKIWVLICTDMISRGIDFKVVNLVVNFDCPYNSVNYIHRIGRTGRAGQEGTAVTFITDQDHKKLKHLSKVLVKSNRVDCADWILKLAKN